MASKYKVTFEIECNDSADPSVILDAMVQTIPDLRGQLEAESVVATIDDGDVSVEEIEG